MLLHSDSRYAVSTISKLKKVVATTNEKCKVMQASLDSMTKHWSVVLSFLYLLITSFDDSSAEVDERYASDRDRMIIGITLCEADLSAEQQKNVLLESHLVELSQELELYKAEAVKGKQIEAVLNDTVSDLEVRILLSCQGYEL
jgi:hypothetical protein